MLQNIDQVKAGELVRELSPEAVTYFMDTELSSEWPKHQMFNQTKFVRLGVGDASRIILGSTIDFGPAKADRYDPEGVRSRLLHIDLYMHAARNLGLSEEDRLSMIESRGERKALSGEGLMMDAGRATILNGSGELPLIMFNGHSFDFGNADVIGRQETALAAETILGDGFEVKAISD